MALSPDGVANPPPLVDQVIAGDSTVDLRITAARQKVLDALALRPEGQRIPALASAAGVSEAVVRGLVKAGRLALLPVARDAPYTQAGGGTIPVLNPEQQRAAAALLRATERRAFQPFLLDGVTGSGKTEVYLEAVAAVLATGRQALIMLPEIGLTAQWLARFQARFGVSPVVWHSGISAAEKRRAWQAVLSGGAQVVVGARSSLMLPFRQLGLIVVDEEHDPSFRQEDGVRYHSRDMAVVRARAAKCPIVLASATPSLESHVNAAEGRYRRLRLRERYGVAAMPHIEVIDMRRSGLDSQHWLSPRLCAAVEERLATGEQTLLFLNRRGYAPLTLCRACGHRFACPNCTTWLVEHRGQGRHLCHQCGFSQSVPAHCPACTAEDSFAACGPGVERLAEEVAARFPAARTQILTSDSLPSADAMARAVAAIEAGNVDIVIGTQLITKGYHFPALTCVGVIDADLGLRGGDLRASERTFQQLTQVAGRAGRAARPGTVFLQSCEPEHPLMAALIAGDAAAFYELEAGERARYAAPPFGRMAALILSGADESAVMDQGRLLARSAPAGDSSRVYGPAPAPLARLRGRFRARLLVTAPRAARLQPVLRDWLDRTRRIKGVRLDVDIDPYSFL